MSRDREYDVNFYQSCLILIRELCVLLKVVLLFLFQGKVLAPYLKIELLELLNVLFFG